MILSGLTYDKKNKRTYNVYNVDIALYETTSQFNGLIKSFNIQTNNWTAKYIYKRLKFLNSKVLSHLLSLTFLAVWHGHKSGDCLSDSDLKMQIAVLIMQNMHHSNLL